LGDLASAVALTDSAIPILFFQKFNPGNSLQFQLSLTTAVDSGGVPDGFFFAILDNTLSDPPTTAGPFFDVFAEIDIDSASPAVATFASDTLRSAVAGGPSLDLGTPLVQTTVPEPGVGSVAHHGFPGPRWCHQGTAIQVTETLVPGGAFCRCSISSGKPATRRRFT
jgi:hypothetical protein